MALPPRYCPRCRAELRDGIGPGGRRACPEPDCEFVHYLDPKLAVVALVEDERGRLLYVRRNHEPQLGWWAWPSGFVDAGERVEEAAVREVREETGVAIELGGLLGVWSGGGDPVVLLVWRARAVGGAARPGDEADAVGWWDMRRPPPPAFAHDESILAAWRESARKAGS